MQDEYLRSFAELKNPERTIRTLNYLRQQQGLSLVPEQASSDDIRALTSAELGRRIVSFAIQAEGAIDKLLEGEPADKQTAVRELIHRLKEMGPSLEGQSLTKDFRAEAEAVEKIAVRTP